MTDNSPPERRRTPRQSPDTSAGWGWLLFGFLAALFVGGAIRGLLSPQKIKLLIDGAIQAGRPPFVITFDSVELSLRDGVLPRLGILAKGLQLKAANPCITGSDLRIRELFVPVSLSEAVMGRLFVRKIQAIDMQLNLRPSSCEVSASPPDRAPAPLEFFDRFFKTRFAQELINTREQLEGLEIENLQIFKEREAQPLLVFSYIRVDSGSDTRPARAMARLELAKHLLGTSVAPYVWIDLQAELNRLQLTARTLFREGLIEAGGMLSLPDTTVQWHADVKHFPLKPLYKYFLISRQNDLVVNSEGAWAFCHLQSSSALVNVFSDWTKVSDCYVEGSLGQLQLEPTQIAFLPQWKMDTAIVQARDLSLGRFFAPRSHLSFGFFDIEPVGHFSGKLELSPTKTKVVGSVQNLELGFWHGLVRGRQPISGAHIEWTSGTTSDMLKISDIEAQGIQWKGQILLQQSREPQTREFQMTLGDVQLDRSLVHLFLPTEVKPFAVKLTGKLNQDQLSYLSGSISVPQLAGPLLSAENIVGTIEKEENVLRGRVEAERVKIFSKPFLEEIKPLFHEALSAEDPVLDFDQLKAKIQYDGQALSWSAIKLLEKNAVGRLLSIGSMDLEGLISATVFRQDIKGQWNKWRLAGSFPLDLQVQEEAMTKPPDRQTRQMFQEF